MIFYLVLRNSFRIFFQKNRPFENFPTSFFQIFLKLIKTVFTWKNDFLTTFTAEKKIGWIDFFRKSNIFFGHFLHFFAYFWPKTQKVPKQPKWPFLTFLRKFFIFTQKSQNQKNSNFWVFRVPTRPSANYLESLKYLSGHLWSSEDSFDIFRAIRNSMTEDWDSQIAIFGVSRHMYGKK